MLCVKDRLAAYQFDAAVTAFGTIIENALHETVERGTGSSKRLAPKYQLSDLLDDRFQFKSEGNGLGLFKQLDGYEEVG